MNIIIVGCGKIGQKLAEKLAQEKEHGITVVDTWQVGHKNQSYCLWWTYKYP